MIYKKLKNRSFQADFLVYVVEYREELALYLNNLPIRNPLPHGFFGAGRKNLFLVLFLEAFVVGE